MPKNIGMILLGVFLILFGLLWWPIIPAFSGHTIVLAILAIVTGVVLLLQR